MPAGARGHAVFHLELGQKDEALALYDGAVREDDGSIALQLVDATALLWRLQLFGVDVGTRWHELARAWEPHVDGRTYPFNDWHAVMALLGAGRERDVDAVSEALRRGASAPSETARWIRDQALPLIDGFAAFSHGDFETAVDRLLDVRGIANVFGGSHAQRDIIDLTLLEACLRGGFTDLARTIANERLTRTPRSRLNAELAARSAARVVAATQAA